MPLGKFITEVRKRNSEDYPPQSIKGMIIAVQMYLKTKRINWRLLNEVDDVFVDLFYVVDNTMKERTERGMGVVNSATPITNSMEDKMWREGVLGEHSPAQLLDTVMYLLGVNLSLRGGNEHRKLRRPGLNEQITVGVDSDNIKCLKFQVDGKSKTNQGGLTCKWHQPKVVNVYQNPDQSRCPVRLFEKYIGLLPQTKKYNALSLWVSIQSVQQ